MCRSVLWEEKLAIDSKIGSGHRRKRSERDSWTCCVLQCLSDLERRAKPQMSGMGDDNSGRKEEERSIYIRSDWSCDPMC